MDQWEKDVIIDNYDKFHESINTQNPTLCNQLVKDKVITRIDVDELIRIAKNESYGQVRNKGKLLDWLMARRDGYNKLLAALEAIGEGEGDTAIMLKRGIEAHEEQIASEENRQQTQAREERLRAQRESARLAQVEEISPNLERLEREILDYISGRSEVKVEIRQRNLVVPGGDSKYALTPNGKRYMLVLNVMEFEDPTKNRSNAGKRDNKNLKELFEGLEFKVFFGCPNIPERVWFEPDDFHKAIAAFRKKCQDDRVEMCAVFVGSHGDQDTVSTSNWKKIHIMNDVVYQFGRWKSHLDGIPKIFIVQSCQDFPTGGSGQGASGPEGPPIEVFSGQTQTVCEPEINDAILIKAALPGGPAYRDDIRGSWLVTAMTCVLMSFAGGMSFQEMFKVVQGLVAKFPDKFDSFECGQMPTSLDLGLKTVYLIPRPA